MTVVLVRALEVPVVSAVVVGDELEGCTVRAAAATRDLYQIIEADKVVLLVRIAHRGRVCEAQ